MIRLTPFADSIFPPFEESSWSSVMGRFSGSWIILLATPSHPSKNPGQWQLRVTFVPTHSGGATTDSHRLPLTQALASFEPLYKPEKFLCQHFFLRLLKN